jgi:hypothetical protein
MSGGDRSGGAPTGDSERCPDFFEPTVLSSPVPRVLAALKPGDKLNVEIFRLAGGRPLLVARADGEIAGSITFAGAGQLIRCLTEGYRYIAIVLEVDGGDCSVEIRRRGSY